MKTRRAIQVNILVVVVLLGCLAGSPTKAENNWPQWLGPQGNGHSKELDLPVHWTKSDIAWKVKFEGRGQSSPVIWEDRIFLTTATDGGRKRFVMCLDRKNGDLLWKELVWTGEPEPIHAMNSYASATCVTDGERVVAFFGRGGIHCFSLDGKKQWSRVLGQFEGPWGTAASPIIVDNLVIQNCDAEDDAYLLGLDKKTGKTLWKTPREKLRGWCTPIVVNTGQRRELVLNGEMGVNAYDPATGKDLWFCRGDRGRGTPTIVPYKETLIMVSGRPGDMLAVRPGGKGAVAESHQVWRTPRLGGRDLPSPIVVGNFLVVVKMNPGLASCYDAATGKELDKIRLEGVFAASPIAANGLIYIPNQDGVVYVLKAGRKLEVISKNIVHEGDEEIFRASLTPNRSQFLFRSDRALYCIGK